MQLKVELKRGYTPSQHGELPQLFDLTGLGDFEMVQALRISGDMDASTMVEMTGDFERLAAGNDDVQLDMSLVTFIDSSGIGGLVFLFKRLHAQARRLRLTGVRGQPRHLMTQLRLTVLFEEGASQAA